jgi:hypothetical protein
MLGHRVWFVTPERNDMDEEPYISKQEDDYENSTPRVDREEERAEFLRDRQIMRETEHAKVLNWFISNNIQNEMSKARFPQCVLQHTKAPENVYRTDCHDDSREDHQ